MKVINISGDNQSGRTRALIDFIEAQVMGFNSKCLIVCPTKEWAANLKLFWRANKNPESFYNVKFISSDRFHVNSAGHSYDVIAFDGIESFNSKFDERYYKVIASSRLLNKPFGTFIYTSDGKNFRVKRWVSEAVWYKPWTWNDGYYTQDTEL